MTKPDEGEGGTRDVNYKALIGNPSLLLLAYTPVRCQPSETVSVEEKRNIESIVVSRATILVVVVVVVTCPALPPLGYGRPTVIVSSRLLSSRLCPTRLRSKWASRVSFPALLPRPDSSRLVPGVIGCTVRESIDESTPINFSRHICEREKNCISSVPERGRYEYFVSIVEES